MTMPEILRLLRGQSRALLHPEIDKTTVSNTLLRLADDLERRGVDREPAPRSGAQAT